MSSHTPAANPPPTPNSPRVLIVDDESIVRSVLRLMLERAGFAVDEASTSAEALAQLQSGAPYALVIVDHTLPDRHGTDAIPELRQAAPGARILLTSGRPEVDLQPHQADGYLAKPFLKEQLAAAIQRVLRAS